MGLTVSDPMEYVGQSGWQGGVAWLGQGLWIKGRPQTLVRFSELCPPKCAACLPRDCAQHLLPVHI